MKKTVTKKAARGRGRPSLYQGAMVGMLHLKLPESAMEDLEQLRLAQMIPPSANAVAREALLIGIAEMKKRQAR